MNGSQMLHKIKTVDWQLGAKNIDDDFHTDILFIRAATKGIFDVVGIKHDCALLTFNGFEGSFYFSKSKTATICRMIIEKLTKEQNLINDIVENITFHATELGDVYKEISCADCFISMNLLDMKILYLKQLNAHTLLYKYAWILEILQVDDFGLTDYLYKYLFNKIRDKETLELYFYILTQSIQKSVYYEEENLIQKLSSCIKNKYIDDTIPPIKYLYNYLESPEKSILEKLYTYYSYLGYHGYGRRKRTSKFDYLEFAIERINNPKKGESQSPSITKEDIYDKLNISQDIQKLFEFYSCFPILKAYRRYNELKNFYYLDSMIEKLAYIKNITEANIRFIVSDFLLCPSVAL